MPSCILPGPSSLWFDAQGNRLPPPCLPGFDTLSTLDRIMKSGDDYSWFVLNQTIVKKEFTLSGFGAESGLHLQKLAAGGKTCPRRSASAGAGLP